ncbi:hypothetical protein [Streptomyces sp. Da 82-17]|uniref:hypothetical protein n=1 Tax=Streptomyces sp. Da 82-17 TaxID=3377116 RepID=UPI0038D4A86B
MALIDDIEFYGSRVDAGDIDCQDAAAQLAAANNGGLTHLGALHAIDNWHGHRDRMQSLAADLVDTLRAVENGRPVPEHVQRHNRERALGMIRRHLRPDADASPRGAR